MGCNNSILKAEKEAERLKFFKEKREREKVELKNAKDETIDILENLITAESKKKSRN